MLFFFKNGQLLALNRPQSETGEIFLSILLNSLQN